MDTLYYAVNLESTIYEITKKANDSALIFAYFSQWIMDESYKLYLQPDMTGLAQVLKELNLSYRAMDLTDSGIQHWKDKEAALVKMKTEFELENNLPLWDRFPGSSRYDMQTGAIINMPAIFTRFLSVNLPFSTLSPPADQQNISN
ncbi:MAG: hypothetical protein R2769_05020 [Saprospiraceae bacterium]